MVLVRSDGLSRSLVELADVSRLRLGCLGQATTISRVSDGLPLAASVDEESVRPFSRASLASSSHPVEHLTDETSLSLSPLSSQIDNALTEHKQQAKLIVRRLSPNSEPLCSIESGAYTLQWALSSFSRPLSLADLAFRCLLCPWGQLPCLGQRDLPGHHGQVVPAQNGLCVP